MTATLTAPPALTIIDGRAAWPLLGNARTAVNADPLVVKVAAGQCTTTYPLSLAVSTTEGAAAGSVAIDPRPAQRAVLPIPDAGDADAEMIVGGSGDVTDVDVRIDELRHTYVGDLRVELLHDGVTVTLIDRLNSGGGVGSYGGHDIVGAVVDSDAAAGPVLVAGGPVSGRFQPTTANALDAFDGHPVAGAWTLRITDGARTTPASCAAGGSTRRSRPAAGSRSPPPRPARLPSAARPARRSTAR